MDFLLSGELGVSPDASVNSGVLSRGQSEFGDDFVATLKVLLDEGDSKLKPVFSELLAQEADTESAASLELNPEQLLAFLEQTASLSESLNPQAQAIKQELAQLLASLNAESDQELEPEQLSYLVEQLLHDAITGETKSESPLTPSQDVSFASDLSLRQKEMLAQGVHQAMNPNEQQAKVSLITEPLMVSASQEQPNSLLASAKFAEAALPAASRGEEHTAVVEKVSMGAASQVSIDDKQVKAERDAALLSAKTASLNDAEQEMGREVRQLDGKGLAEASAAEKMNTAKSETIKNKAEMLTSQQPPSIKATEAVKDKAGDSAKQDVASVAVPVEESSRLATATATATASSTVATEHSASFAQSLHSSDSRSVSAEHTKPTLSAPVEIQAERSAPLVSSTANSTVSSESVAAVKVASLDSDSGATKPTTQVLDQQQQVLQRDILHQELRQNEQAPKPETVKTAAEWRSAQASGGNLQSLSANTEPVRTDGGEGKPLLQQDSQQGSFSQGQAFTQPHSQPAPSAPNAASSSVDLSASAGKESFTSIESKSLHAERNGQSSERISLNSQQAPNQLNEKVQYMVNQGMQRAEIRLDPAELGSMQIRVQMNNDQVSVQIQAQNPQAREMLEQTMPRLREMLQQQGIDLGQANINQQQQGQREMGQSAHNQNSSARQGEGLAALSENEANLEQESSTFYSNATNSERIDFYA